MMAALVVLAQVRMATMATRGMMPGGGRITLGLSYTGWSQT
jgi:hypothetical protein